MAILYKNTWMTAAVATLQLCLPLAAVSAEPLDEATLPTVTVKPNAKQYESDAIHDYFGTG